MGNFFTRARKRLEKTGKTINKSAAGKRITKALGGFDKRLDSTKERLRTIEVGGPAPVQKAFSIGGKGLAGVAEVVDFFVPDTAGQLAFEGGVTLATAGVGRLFSPFVSKLGKAAKGADDLPPTFTFADELSPPSSVFDDTARTFDNLIDDLRPTVKKPRPRSRFRALATGLTAGGLAGFFTADAINADLINPQPRFFIGGGPVGPVEQGAFFGSEDFSDDGLLRGFGFGGAGGAGEGDAEGSSGLLVLLGLGTAIMYSRRNN